MSRLRVLRTIFSESKTYQGHTDHWKNVPSGWIDRYKDVQINRWVNEWEENRGGEGRNVRKLSNLLRWTSHFFPGNQDTQTTYGQRHLKKGIYCNTIRGNNSLKQLMKWLHKILLQREPACTTTKGRAQISANWGWSLRFIVKWQKPDTKQHVGRAPIFLKQLGGGYPCDWMCSYHF